MNFDEAGRQYSTLKDQYDNRLISFAEFEEKAQNLVATAPDGRKFFIDPRTGTWVEVGAKSSSTPTGGPSSRGKEASPPETLLQFLSLIGKSIVKSIPKLIVISLGISLLTWAYHTYLVAVVNDGLMYNPSRQALNSVIHIQESYFPGINAFWGLLAYFLKSFVMRIFQMGPQGWVEHNRNFGTHIRQSYFKLGKRAPEAILMGAAIALIFAFLYRNFMLSWVLALGFVIIALAHFKGLEIMVVKVGFSDLERLLKRRLLREGEELDTIFLAFLGMAGGFLLAGLMGTRFWAGLVFGLLFLLAFVLYRKRELQGATLLILLALGGALLLPESQVLAWCEGGSFTQGGGNWVDWWGSDNADVVRQNGIGPALSAAMGAMLGGMSAAGAAGANIAAPGVSPHLSPGQEGYGDSSPEPAPDDFSDTPPPSRTMSLQGDKALEWLQERGLIEKADDGGYQFVDRDNVLNNFPGGRGGYVQGAQPDPNRVDDDIIIIFEPETPGPGQEEPPPYGDYEIPPEPGVEEGPGEEPSDELPQEEGKELPDERVKKQEEGDTSPEDDSPQEEEREETGEPEEPEEPGEGEEPQEAEEPEEKIDEKGEEPQEPEEEEDGEEPPPQEDGGEEGKEPAPPSQDPEDKEVDPSREPRETDAPDAPPVPDPTRGERPLEETLGRGRGQAKETAEIAKEIEGYIKDSQGNIKDLQRATREVQGIIDELGVNPEDAGVIRDSLDRVNESLESINKGLESLQGICSSTKEYAEKVQEILERGGRIAEAYNNMYDRLPPYINDRARTGLSSYAAALQTAGEGVDKAFRSIPKVGDYLADALNTAELGGEMGEALYRGVENVTAADRRHYEEAIKPVTDRLMNDPHYTPSREDLELSGLTAEEIQIAREQGARQREIQRMVTNEHWGDLKRYYPQEYEKYREALEQRTRESYHPPPGTYDEPSLLARVFNRIFFF